MRHAKQVQSFFPNCRLKLFQMHRTVIRYRHLQIFCRLEDVHKRLSSLLTRGLRQPNMNIPANCYDWIHKIISSEAR